MSDKIINNSDHFKIKCLSYSKISAILCVFYFCFLHFLFNLRKHCANFVFLAIFDTCDVIYYWSISLLPEEERQSAPVSRIGSISQITDAAVEVTESIES